MVIILFLGGGAIRNTFRRGLNPLIGERSILFIFVPQRSRRGFRGRDRIVVGLTTIYPISTHHHKSCDRVRIPIMARCTRYNLM
jgi:hypothetical protein